jgi:hypothetical protein
VKALAIAGLVVVAGATALAASDWTLYRAHVGDGDVRLIDVRSGDTRIAAGAHAGGAHAVAFDPRRQTIATGSRCCSSRSTTRSTV